jgi:hypothetical protein
MGSDRILPRYAFHKPFIVKFPDRCEWQNRFNPENNTGVVWYTDRSKISKGTGAGVYRWGLRMVHSFSLGLLTTVFQAKIYAIKACIMENIEKGYAGGNICILADSQAAIMAIDSFQINSKLVWDCHQSLVKLAKHNRVQQVWVPKSMGIDGIKITDPIAREGSSHPLIGSEPALGISAKVARGLIRDWTNRRHEVHWQSICGQRQAKGFLK